jgi:hypothetical protein
MSTVTSELALTAEVGADDINIDYAADDSCQLQCWARGHIEPNAFRQACELALKKWDEREVVLNAAPVSHKSWRTVRPPRELAELGVCDFIHVESKPGRGAYPVTVLEEWLPLHRLD